MLKTIWNVIGHTMIILRQESVNHRQLALTYLGLAIRRLFRKRHENGAIRFIDYTFEYFDFLTLVSLFEEIFVNRQYFFLSEAKSPLIIDCGSNIGMSVAFFKHTYPQSRIMAFEPDKITFEVLKRNVERNHFRNITLFNSAVYSFDGTVDFYSDSVEKGSLMMSMYSQRLNAKHDQVQAVRLSTYIESPVDFLKLDVEGAETPIIEEIAESGKLRLVRQMVIEYHHHINQQDDRLSRLLSLLEANEFGYQIVTDFRTPFQADQFQDILIYCYQKHSGDAMGHSSDCNPSSQKATAQNYDEHV